MIKSLTIKKPESEHRIFGAGAIEINFISGYNSVKAELIIKSNLFEHKFTGNEAESLCKKYFSDEELKTLSIDQVKELAAKATHTESVESDTKTRHTELVQARQLVMWYAFRKLQFSYQKAADIYEQDHATAMHAVNQIEKDEKYKKPQHSEMHKRFFELINEATI